MLKMAANFGNRGAVGPPPPYSEFSNPFVPGKCNASVCPDQSRTHMLRGAIPSAPVTAEYRSNGVLDFTPENCPATIYFISGVIFGPVAVRITCPYCQSQVVTATHTRAGLLAWLICGGLALLGCWICCVLPFCLSSCQDVEHYCPKCKRLIATYRRL